MLPGGNHIGKVSPSSKYPAQLTTLERRLTNCVAVYDHVISHHEAGLHPRVMPRVDATGSGVLIYSVSVMEDAAGGGNKSEGGGNGVIMVDTPS